jgi:hypothetical protein
MLKTEGTQIFKLIIYNGLTTNISLANIDAKPGSPKDYKSRIEKNQNEQTPVCISNITSQFGL